MKRDMENRMLFGVCAGIAKQLEVDPGMVRILTVVAFVLTGSIVGWVYLAAGLLLPKE